MSSQSHDEAVQVLTTAPDHAWPCPHYEPEPCSNRECLSGGCAARRVRELGPQPDHDALDDAYNDGYHAGWTDGFDSATA